jgi:hypothetical protein
MKVFKEIIHMLSKAVGAIAVIVFFFAPFTNLGLVLMAGAVIVGLACLPVYLWSESDEDEATDESN